MADSTPLLSESDSVHSASGGIPTIRKHAATLDDAIEQCIGEFSRTQFWQAFLVSFAWFFDAQQTFISVFTDAEPKWHYISAAPSRLAATDSNSAASSTVCHLPPGSWAWDRPAYTSVVSEWDLQCSGPIISGLPASSFFMGCLLGGLVLSTLADSCLGRKHTLSLSCFVMSLASALLAVTSGNVWVYSGLKFVAGFGRAAIGSCALVLSSEMVGKRWRGHISVFGFFCFTFGFLSLPATAYLNRSSSWRTLYLWTSLPTIIYCVLVHLLVRESPRWLYVRGRKEEAVATLRSIAAERSSMTLSFFDLPSGEQQEDETGDVYAALKVLVQKRWVLRRLLMAMAVVLGLGMVYYAMPLALGELAFDNLYVSVAFNAFSEVPAALLCFFLIGKMDRRPALLGLCFLSGICSVACGFTGGVWGLQAGLELLAFFAACTAFNIVLIYSIELFPTSVRNSALSMVRQALVAGGIVGPVVVAAGRKNRWLTFVVFGVVIGCCGLFAMFLPETRGRALYDTTDEVEREDVPAPNDEVSDEV